MSDDPGSQAPTFTQEEVDALIAKEVEGLKANREEALQRYQKTRDQLKAFDGLDAEEVRQKLAKLDELEQKGKAQKAGVTDEQLQKLRQDIRADLEKEYTPFKTQAEELAGRVRTLQLDNVVKKLMAENGVRGERVDALFRLTADQFDLTEDGKPMLREHMGKEVDKYIADELAKQYPEFYQGSGSSGGGAQRSAGVAAHVRSIPAGDNEALLANLERVAKGEVVVTE